jgi:ParB family chromosome partitioning protein
MAEIKDMQKKPLGRGLGSLLGDDFLDEAPKAKTEVIIQKVETAIPENQRIWEVDIEKITPNEFQPRKTFVAEKLAELTASIKEKGILQPIVVRKTAPDKFELIAGERRWRAAQAAGLHKVPVIIKNVQNQESLELALIENIQRHDLNPIDEAEAYQQLAQQFLLSQAEIAQKVGKERATVANALRLLSLEPSVRQMLINGEITTGHAKALLAMPDQSKQKELAKKITSEKLTVRAAEKIIQASQKKKGSADDLDIDVSLRLIKGLQDDLIKALGTKVEINYNGGKGTVAIKFYSDEDLTRIIERIKK